MLPEVFENNDVGHYQIDLFDLNTIKDENGECVEFKSYEGMAFYVCVDLRSPRGCCVFLMRSLDDVKNGINDNLSLITHCQRVKTDLDNNIKMIPGGFETAITYEIAKKFKQWLLATGKKKYIKNTFDDYLLEYT